jgi:RNA polymerase sigma-70 factor, ECF subfamily
VESRRDRFERVAPGLIEPVRRYLARRTDPDTAEDVLAETLLVCWRRIEDLPGEPLPWAYGVARMCLRNAERAARRQRRVAAKVAALDPPRSVAGADESGDPGVALALSRLRAEDAEVLRLWAWEELAPPEIGAVLGCTANAASIRLHRARQRLRDELRKIERGSGHEGT